MNDFAVKTREDLTAALDFLARYTGDPVGFVKAAFDWENDPTLKGKSPQRWQLDILQGIKDKLPVSKTALRFAVASGHGIGKSALVAWLVLWGLCTYPDSRIVVTANTDTQLKSKTWPEVQKWYNKFILKDLFECTATTLSVRESAHAKTWQAAAIPWSKENSEAFAGLHNQGKRIILIFDEGSAIDNVIWEVAEGALTDKDTQIIWCAFGNPTRNTGRFYECFHKYRNLWQCRQIDSRDVDISNKEQLQQWVDTYGLDSDFVRVRVLGEFPNSSEYQFISRQIVENATKRTIKQYEISFAPKIIGVDPAWTGSDEISIYFRQGLYSKLLGAYQKNDDDMRMANIIAGFEDKYKADAVNIDFGYGTGIYSAGRSMGRTWNLIQFGSKAIKKGYANKRAEIWGEMKQWLIDGGAIEDDQTLKDDLTSPEYTITNKGEILLESKDSMKKRGLASPNRADALALTFAINIIRPENRVYRCNTKYDPFDRFK